jgi:hypothetical protein
MLGQLGDRGNVIVGALIGDRLDPVEQGKVAVRRKQRRLGPMPGHDVGGLTDRASVALEVAHKIEERRVLGAGLASGCAALIWPLVPPIG